MPELGFDDLFLDLFQLLLELFVLSGDRALKKFVIITLEKLSKDLYIQKTGQDPVVGRAQEYWSSVLESFICVQIVGLNQDVFQLLILHLLEVQMSLRSSEEYL